MSKESEHLAEKYIKRGKYKEAIKEYQKLLTGGDQDIPIRNTLGDLYVKAGRSENAVLEFKRVAKHYEDKGIFAKSIALYKRITRLDPENHDCAEKLGDLLWNQGFVTEAKAEYLSLAKLYEAHSQAEGAIRILHKLLEINREDFNSRQALVELYIQEEQVEPAVEELNELAEILVRKNRTEEAKQFLRRAQNLLDYHPRTLSNLIDLLRKENKNKEALGLIRRVLDKDENNIKALKIFGNLLFAQNDYKQAESVFAKILSLQPGENNVRIRLGKIYLREGQQDDAFNLFEPLVESFLDSNKEEKAISLLGLIIQTGLPHLPSLERLASIFRRNNQGQNLENVNRILLHEYRKKNQEDKMLHVLKELVRIVPESEEYYCEYQKLKNRLGIVDKKEEEDFERREKAEEKILAHLAKVDLYIEQGLVRNARRILDNLKIDFPADPRINIKMDVLKTIDPNYDREEIPDRVEKVSEKESKLFPFKETTPVPDKTVSVADIFADTDLIPFAPGEGVGREFFDLSDRIDEELEAIRDVVTLQQEGELSTFEKPLSEIISEFKKDIGDRLKEADLESRYNLGLAFMEQELWDEAIEEFRLACRDSSLAVDCYLVLSLCYRKKEDFLESLSQLNRGLEVAREKTSQYYSLKYELASLHEEMNESLKAMQVFLEIKEWKSDYRDVNQRLKELAEKIN